MVWFGHWLVVLIKTSGVFKETGTSDENKSHPTYFSDSSHTMFASLSSAEIYITHIIPPDMSVISIISTDKGPIFGTACKANHTHTWWYNMSLLNKLGEV